MTDIHDLFHDNDIPDPATNGWVDNVHARRRKTRLVTGVAAGVLAIGLAVPVGIALLNQSGGNPVAEPVVAATSSDQPAATSQPGDPGVLPVDPSTPTIGGAPACKEVAGIVASRSEDATPPALTEGARKAWLCGDGIYAGALDPLTVGVDDAIASFLSQPAAPSDQACTMEYTMGYTVVFEYADGSLIPVTGELHGCRTTSDGATVRQGGAEFLDTVTTLWKKQRATAETGNEAAEQCSDETQSILPADLTQVAAVQTCTRSADGWETQRIAVLNDATIRTNEDLAKAVVESMKSASPVGDVWEERQPQRRLELIDAWGSKVTLTELKDGAFLVSDAGSATKAWTPSPELAAMLGLGG